MFDSVIEALRFAAKERQHIIALKIQRLFYELRREQKIGQDHIATLISYLNKGCAPDPRSPKETQAARLWNDVVATLEPLLRKEGYLK